MNVPSIQVTQEQAKAALLQYKAHRNTYDARDWEIERIYRNIARGRTVISVHDAIRAGGIDHLGRPRLAIMRADQDTVRCSAWFGSSVTFTNEHRSHAREWHFDIKWPGRAIHCQEHLHARLPRIPPQFRPVRGHLADYHLLWEADWTAIPRDPLLLKRIGLDAWIVLAAWDLTEVEMNVLRARG